MARQKYSARDIIAAIAVGAFFLVLGIYAYKGDLTPKDFVTYSSWLISGILGYKLGKSGGN